MTTIHDEGKIKEILLTRGEFYAENVYISYEPLGIEIAMKEYAEHIRLKTIDEAIGCVPEVQWGDPSSPWTIENDNGFNTCRSRTLINLEQLKK